MYPRGIIGVVESESAAPVLDLDTGSGGTSYAFNYTERTVQAMIGANVSITDADSTTLVSAEIDLTNDQTGDVVQVAAGLPSGITSNIVGHTITLSSATSNTLAEYETALQLCELKNPRFSDNGASPLNTTARTINVKVNDGTADSNVAVATGTIVANLSVSAIWTYPDDQPELEGNGWDPVNSFEDDAGTDPAEIGDGVANITSERNDADVSVDQPLLETVSGERPILKNQGSWNNNGLDFQDFGDSKEIQRNFTSYTPTHYVVCFGMEMTINPPTFFNHEIFNTDNGNDEINIQIRNPFLAPVFVRVRVDSTDSDFDDLSFDLQTIRLELDDGTAELFYDDVSQGTFTYSADPTIGIYRFGRVAEASFDGEIGRNMFMSSNTGMPTSAQIERAETWSAAS